jgi:hypothetical protein
MSALARLLRRRVRVLLKLLKEVPDLTIGDENRRTLCADCPVTFTLDVFCDCYELDVLPGVSASPLFHAVQRKVQARERLELQVNAWR